ncbi:BON domain-containing protein [bacterium]|nr:BON domain-containing protein [bacterium]
MIRRVLPALLAASALTACAVVQEKTLGESFDEASASNQIKSRLIAAGASRFAEVDVEVAQRFVLLSGRVPTPEDRMEAERIAWTVTTIDEVANELIVGPRDIGREFNDEWITARVRSRLVGDAEIKGVNYNIETFAGVVYLLGLAQSEDELRRAAEHASMVKGVQRVVSYVKMRDRSPSPATVAPPDLQPVQRGTYSDPYEEPVVTPAPTPAVVASELSAPSPTAAPAPSSAPTSVAPTGGGPTDLRPRNPDNDLVATPRQR